MTNVGIYPALHTTIYPHKVRSPVTVQNEILANTYTESARGRGKSGRKKISEVDATTLPPDSHMIYPLLPTIVKTGHSARRDDSSPASSRDAIRSVKVNSTDIIVSKSGRLKATAVMASTAAEATARRHIIRKLTFLNLTIFHHIRNTV